MTGVFDDVVFRNLLGASGNVFLDMVVEQLLGGEGLGARVAERFDEGVGEDRMAVLAAFVEEFGTNRASIRLNFVDVQESSSGSGMKSRTDQPILDPKVYQNSFSKIQEAIFIREGFK